MNNYDQVCQDLISIPRRWLITGVAGFIGSNLLEELLSLNQFVVGLDDFSTGYEKNLEQVRRSVSAKQWSNFKLVKGDIRDYSTCYGAMCEVDYVLHQAALGSVPRSLKNPLLSNSVNVGGFLNMLESARQRKVVKFIYASSSSVYGDHPVLPKIEDQIGESQSPYAVTKYVNELYASVFERNYGLSTSGLRYFNVFGPRQDPSGPYSAVIPRWIKSMINGLGVTINGDGSTSRDFCFVKNVVQANILAAHNHNKGLCSPIFNVSVGGNITLLELFNSIKNALVQNGIVYEIRPTFLDFRSGDIKHSQADISKIKQNIGYKPLYSFEDGILSTVKWFCVNEK